MNAFCTGFLIAIVVYALLLALFPSEYAPIDIGPPQDFIGCYAPENTKNGSDNVFIGHAVGIHIQQRIPNQ